MSSISITGTAHVELPSVRTRLRITERGRRVLAFVVSLPLVIALGLSVMAGGNAIAARDTANQNFASVTVVSGDTLWSIAEEIAPAADPRDVVGDIMNLNALSDTALRPGQSLAIPTQYAPAE